MKKTLLPLLGLLFICSAAKANVSPSSPLHFIENRGQLRGPDGNDVLFMLRGQQVQIFVGRNSLHYLFIKDETPALSKKEIPGNFSKEKTKATTYRLDMYLQDANSQARLVTGEANAYYEQHYTRNGDRIEAKTYDRITLENIYAGIDWVLYIQDGKLKYDFVVHPGGDASRIRMKYAGAENLSLDKNGSLKIKTQLGEVTEEKPYSYLRGNKKAIRSAFHVKGNEILFSLAPVSSKETIVIDPGLAWSSYYGGTEDDLGYDVDTDKEGNVFLTGYTKSYSDIDFNGFLNYYVGDKDAFLVKFDRKGTRLWATYYGDIGNDVAVGVSVDDAGNAYIAGYTESQTNISSNGHQNNYGGGSYDAFLVKFTGDGQRMWATYFGGDDLDVCEGLEADKFGNVYIAGTTISINVNIAYMGHQNNPGGDQDAYLAKFDSSGTLKWATYYGGLYEDRGTGVTIDAFGSVFLGGTTASEDSIGFNGYQSTYENNTDAFVVKFAADGTRQWGTYYGGEEFDMTLDIHCDGSNIYLTGLTQSTTKISSNGHQNTMSGYQDAYLVKFTSSGTREWATYYGGKLDEAGYGIATDIWNNVYLVGYSQSDTGIATAGGFQPTYARFFDGFLAKFNHKGERQWGTYYGGNGSEYFEGVEADNFGNVYASGLASSTNLASNGHQNVQNGMLDALLVKFYTSSVFVDSAKVVCDSLHVSFRKDDMAYGNQYIIQLSNAVGSFTSPASTFTINDSLPGMIHKSIMASGLQPSSMYSLRVISTAPVDTAYFIGNITVTGLPNTQLQLNGAAVFCEPGQVIISAATGTGYTYEWYEGANKLTDITSSITVNTSGTYKAKISDANGCSIFSDDAIITIWPKPAKPTITRNANVLDAGSGYMGYQWYINNAAMNNETQQTLTVTINATYKVEVEDVNGCRNESDPIVIANAGTGNISMYNFTAYPNPTAGEMTIETPVDISAGIYTLEGKLWKQLELKAGKNQLVLTELAAGVYMLKAHGELQFAPYKLIRY